MYTHMKQTILISLLLISTIFQLSAQGNNSTGKVLSFTIDGYIKTNDGPASYAAISITDLNLHAAADENGYFKFKRIPQGKHEIQVQSMGYADKTINTHVANEDVHLSIKLDNATFELEEVEVMAKKNQRNKLEIKETAIEYVQPTSLSDVFVLLPGNLYKENALTSFSLNTNRQVGSDKNTSLGIGLVADGIPQLEDGNRTQMIGITDNSSSSTDGQITSRTGINAGTDMRYISTDHIQSVEVERGISSPRYGNISSGQIHINSKYGVSPLKIRTKIDLKNKLIYAGKGFSLGEKKGTLHIGADFLHSVDDIREEMEKFSRFTTQLYYNNKVVFKNNTSLDLDAKIAQTISVNKMKKDELTYEYNETYMADYNKTDFMLKGKFNVDKKWIDNVELLTSFNRVKDRIDRHYCVITGNPKSMPLSYEEGEHEGYYLPTMYYSDFYVENIPLNFYSQLNINSRVNITPKSTLKLEYGVDFHSIKNKGDGAVIENEKLPPFPNNNTYMRPRRNYEIPAIENGAAYLQTTLIVHPTENQTGRLNIGYRFSELFNLPEDYALNHRLLVEPRINMNYAFGKKVKHNIRLGYGEENKLPTMDYLYPEKIYKDFWMLNAYTNNSENRHLITYTKVYDAANKDLKENKNRKVEVGYDFDWKQVQLSCTAFFEKSTTGFEYFTFYSPVSYQRYMNLKEDVDISNRRPEKTDYEEQTFKEFTTYTQVMNSKKTIKKGIEYRLTLPKIRKIKTDVEINGAYYQTDYGSSLPDYYYPNSKIGDNLYPYVGVYDLDSIRHRERLNTNFWFNTHIPRFKIIFTNFFQFVWLQTSQYTDNFEGTYKKVPYEYIDFNGVTHKVTQEELAKIYANDDIQWYQLRRPTTTRKYAKEEKPIYILWNIKVTKEFGSFVKLSMFVNNIVDVHPKYLSNTSSQTKREWSNPYFGMEMILNVAKKGNKK